MPKPDQDHRRQYRRCSRHCTGNWVKMRNPTMADAPVSRVRRCRPSRCINLAPNTPAANPTTPCGRDYQTR